MKKVYVLMRSWQFDSGECGQDVGLYSTKAKARKAMEKLIEDARKDTPADCYVENTYEDVSYSRYEDGEYCYNHIDIDIIECVVQ